MKFDLNTKNIDFNPDNLSKLDLEKVLELLDDSCDYDKYKDTILNSEEIDLTKENILSDINMIIDNLDDSLTPLEKLRTIYICFGKLFSYDYRVCEDIKYGILKTININKYIGRYQTCIQIPSILCYYLNRIDGIKASVIERKLDNNRNEYGNNHVANKVEVMINEKQHETYLLDLTLDLYLIQSGCRTMHFGYEDNINGEYDIIPQIVNYEIDKKLGLLTNDNYTNRKINEIKEYISRIDFQNKSSKEILDTYIISILPLIKTFPGYHEGKQYINMIFKNVLKTNYKEFNLYFRNGNATNFKTCFLLEYENYQKWIIYSNKLGLMSTSVDNINNMIENGWQTNSSSLKKLLNKKKVYRKY